MKNTKKLIVSKELLSNLFSYGNRINAAVVSKGVPPLAILVGATIKDDALILEWYHESWDEKLRSGGSYGIGDEIELEWQPLD